MHYTIPHYVYNNNDHIQMSAFMFPEGSTIYETLFRAGSLIVWISVILKVLAYSITTYWRVNRLHNSKLRQQFQMPLNEQQQQQR
jgi:hypothetical protein